MDSSCLPQGLLAHSARSLQTLLRPLASPDPADKRETSGDGRINENAYAVTTQSDSCTTVLLQQIGRLAADRAPTEPAQYRTTWHSILNDVLTSLSTELRKETVAGETARKVCAGELTAADLLLARATSLQVGGIEYAKDVCSCWSDWH